MDKYLLESMPIAGIYLAIVLLILASCEAGFQIGHHHHRTRQDEAAPASVGPMVGALLGMLAFVLAFTFSMAATHHGVRKQNVLAEANYIGRAYLRADLIGEPDGAEVKRLLREYVETRLSAARRGGNLQAALKRSLEIQDLLWKRVSSAAIANPSAFTSLAVQSINDVIDMHERRLTDAVHARIPGSIWLGLMAITVLTMGTMGLQIGLSGKRRLVGIVPIALAFAVLATLVLDLNRPQGGFITVGQQAMIDLQAMMNRTAR